MKNFLGCCMVPAIWSGRILGVLAVVSILAIGIGFFAYSPEIVIPREAVCIRPAAGGGGVLADYLDVLVAGRGAGAAGLVRLRATIGPDGVPVSVDLEYYTAPEGKNRFCQLTYRRGTGTCGWTDGLSYPAGSGEMPEALPADGARAIAVLGMLRFPDHAGRIVLIDTGWPGARAADLLSLPVRPVRENGTPARPDEGPFFPFSLMVSEKICTQADGRNEQCTVVPVERLLIVDGG